MPVKFSFKNPYLKTWLLLHQTYNLVLRSEDNAFAKEGITTQQHSVLMAIRYMRTPVTPTEVANWLDRNPNGISMLIDRMEKDSLVKRVKDLHDRRSVRLVITKKGNEILNRATVIGWQLIEKILSDIQEEELLLLTDMLEKVREKAFEYLHPDRNMTEIKIKNEEQQMNQFFTDMSKYSEIEPDKLR
jgi:DNA-binding MarR family transcriptional regulator